MRTDVALLVISLLVLLAAASGCAGATPIYDAPSAAHQERFEKVWYACRHHIVPRVCDDHIGTSYLDCIDRKQPVCMLAYGYEQISFREWVLTQDGRRQVEIEALVDGAAR